MSKIEFLKADELLTKGVVERDNKSVKFNDNGFKNVLAAIATYKLHPNMFLKPKSYSNEIIDCLNDSIFTKRITKTCVFWFINSKKTENFNNEYQRLKNKTYVINSFLKDIDIDNFVAEQITDEINLNRSKWFEYNCINMFTNRVFKEISAPRINQFFNSIEKDNSGSTNRAIDKHLKDVLKSNYSNMNNEIYLLLLRVFDFKNSPKIFSNYLFQSFAIDYRLYNQFYAKNILEIRLNVSKIIDNGLNKKNNKTRKPRL